MQQKLKKIVKYKYYTKIINNKKKKNIILKSIIQNSCLKLKYNYAAKIFLTSLNKNLRFNRTKNICLLSGKQRGVWKKFNLSRHKIKYLTTINKLPKVKLLSW